MESQELQMQELTMAEIEQASGASLTTAGYGVGVTTAAAVGFGFFGPVGAAGSAIAFSAGFFGGGLLRYMFK